MIGVLDEKIALRLSFATFLDREKEPEVVCSNRSMLNLNDEVNQSQYKKKYQFILTSFTFSFCHRTHIARTINRSQHEKDSKKKTDL